MLATILTGLACLVIGVAIGFGRSWLDGFELGGWGDEAEGERRRDRELARQQAEVLAAMHAASERDGGADPFRRER